MNTLPTTMKAVVFPGREKAELRDWPAKSEELKPNEVAGRTLVSLVSPGTELNWGFVPAHDSPVIPGYAAIFEIDALGAEVTDLSPGQKVFCMGNHVSRQRCLRSDVLAVPEGLAPQEAVFARLMGVSWSTLTTTVARPAERVLILGLGIVGNMAVQIFQTAGYTVTAVDPVDTRQQLARQLYFHESTETNPQGHHNMLKVVISEDPPRFLKMDAPTLTAHVQQDGSWAVVQALQRMALPWFGRGPS